MVRSSSERLFISDSISSDSSTEASLSQEEAGWQAFITPDDVLTDEKNSPPMRQEEILLQIDTLPPRDKDTACRILEAYIKGITSI